MIIGISGRIGSGKDTTAMIIQLLTDPLGFNKDEIMEMIRQNKTSNHCVFRNKKFAGKLKEIASILTGHPVELFESIDFKNSKMDDCWGDMTYREFLQKLGTEAIRDNIHNEAWVNALFSDYKLIDLNLYLIKHGGDKEKALEDQKSDGLPKWVISDVRFPNEFNAIKQRDGIVVRVQNGKETEGGHISETALDLFQFDYILNNKGTINDLIVEVEKMLIHFNIL